MRAAMVIAAFRSTSRTRPVAWLLALALWLPAAQWAAATHALLHLDASAGASREQPADLPAGCDLCVVAAAAIGGAAPPSGASLSLFPPAPAAQPSERDVVASAAAPAHPYQSRAPPFLPA